MLQRPHVQTTHSLHTLGAPDEVSNSSWKAGRLCPHGTAEDMKVTQQVLGDLESGPGEPTACALHLGALLLGSWAGN